MELEKRFEQLEKMRMGTNNRFPLTLRGFTGTFRPLSIYETNVVAAETMAELQQKPKSQQNQIMENTLLSLKILEKASTSDVGKTDPQITFLELQNLSPKEIEFLYAEYVTATEKLDPRLEELDKKQILSLVEEAKKKEDGLASELAKLSFWQVWNIAVYCLTKDEQPTDK